MEFNPLKIRAAFEKLKDIYCDRAIYKSNEKWVADMDVEMKKLCEMAGFDFEPQKKEE